MRPYHGASFPLLLLIRRSHAKLSRVPAGGQEAEEKWFAERSFLRQEVAVSTTRAEAAEVEARSSREARDRAAREHEEEVARWRDRASTAAMEQEELQRALNSARHQMAAEAAQWRREVERCREEAAAQASEKEAEQATAQAQAVAQVRAEAAQAQAAWEEECGRLNTALRQAQQEQQRAREQAREEVAAVRRRHEAARQRGQARRGAALARVRGRAAAVRDSLQGLRSCVRGEVEAAGADMVRTHAGRLPLGNSSVLTHPRIAAPCRRARSRTCAGGRGLCCAGPAPAFARRPRRGRRRCCVRVRRRGLRCGASCLTSTSRVSRG